MKTRIRAFALTSIFAALSAALPAFAGDSCAAPTPVAGSVIVPFDFSGSTLDGQGNLNGCLVNGSTIARDLWFCFTSDVDGTVTISTCGYTQLDTALAIYPDSVGCGCPGDTPPTCCADDVCGKQAELTCDVRCGHRYMVQLGAKAGGSNPIGQIKFSTVGNPCDNGGGGNNTPISCDCCGERPPLADSLATPFDPGLVSAVTNYQPSANSPAVYLIDLGGQGSAPLGANWATDRYSHPDWSMGKLGGVFGVTLDSTGNIFAAHTSVYSMGNDPLGFGGPGAIYRLDGNTGSASLVIALPQQLDPTEPVGQQYPGIGQLTWDCGSNRLYASNFEDGRIYAIDPSAPAGSRIKAILDHNGTANPPVSVPASDGTASIPGEPAGFSPLGERVWALKATGGRLYYSIWEEDLSRPNATKDNTVWSVGLDANGNFVANSARFELSLPHYSGNASMPIADISFDDNCCMLLAERSMYDDGGTTAHSSRAFRICQDAAGAWGVGQQYVVGGYSVGDNATGGIGYAGGGLDQVWNMSDAISYPNPAVYGLYGQSAAGSTPAQSLWVDVDGNTGNGQTQKTQLGSIELNCLAAEQPCKFSTQDIECKPNADGTMGFVWHVQITNNSAIPANLLILPDNAFSPNNVLVINPPLAPGASTTLVIPINIGVPGSQFCFGATLAGSTGDACCTEEVCIDLPDCTCMQTGVSTQDVAGANNFQFSISLTNLTPFPGPGFAGEWVSLAVAPGYAATITPTLIDIPTLPLLASTTVGPISVSTALPAGTQITVIVGLHSQTFHPCCFREITVTVPAANASTVPGDATGDGVVNAKDLGSVLSNWGGAGSTDFNHDGTTNGQDLAILLANWG